jgi:hypothetical protein
LPGQLIGHICDASGAKTAEFRAFYASADTGGIPVRIEYRPRSFLTLVFEEASAPLDNLPIRSLFRKENV